MRNERPSAVLGLVASSAIAAVILAGVCRGEEWKPPPVQLSKDAKHPVVACTPEELGRLRAAWGQAGPDHDVVAGLVARADQALKQPLVFPPRAVRPVPQGGTPDGPDLPDRRLEPVPDGLRPAARGHRADRSGDRDG